MSDERLDRDGRVPDRNGGAGRGDEDAISRSIKRVYDRIADEPLPDSLQSLLDRLQESEKGE